MKKLITAFIGIIGLWSANAQVNIDKVNAPKNPVGPYWAELKNSEAKGDVYSIAHVVFPRDGKLVYTQSKNTYEQALKDKTTYTEIKNGLIVKQKSNFDDLANLYDYDANKNIIREENSFWIYTYKYDAKNRLIEKIATSQKETKTERETYNYEFINGELIVTTTYYGKNKNTVGKSHYINGLEILSTYENDVRKTEHTFDEKGNWTKKTTYDASWGNNTLERAIIYYSDLDYGIKNKQFNWERVPFTQGSTIGFPVIIYNDRKAPNFWLGTKKFNPTRTIDNSALFYLELGDSYYYGKDAFKSKEDIGLKGIATEVSVGSEALLESKNKYVKMHDKGKSFFKFSDYLADKSYYIADSLGTTHYIINNFDANSERQFYPATKYTDTHMFYTIEAEKNSYQLFENGKRLDYTGITRWQFTETGDQVVQYKGKPYMILVGSNKNKTRGFYPAKAYNGEKIFDNDPTNPNNNAKISEIKPINTSNSLFAKKILAIPAGTEQHKQTKAVLLEMENSLVAKGLSFEQKNDDYVKLFNELYNSNKNDSFRLIMAIDDQYNRSIMEKFTTEQKTFILEKSRQKINGVQLKNQ